MWIQSALTDRTLDVDFSFSKEYVFVRKKWSHDDANQASVAVGSNSVLGQVRPGLAYELFVMSQIPRSKAKPLKTEMMTS